ncbi:putative SWI/SNF-related matrix-associated actin-dependent regulator of chromatin subfamily A member 3-like 1 [Heracleum sosnowskyi]|uniref:SWI/SNF-related matrix-associated actin-dependent regulator of chromatin subfamily A member 3-like 1 n=1 Tax=Heracleum sosnowskyi TaxID=360622 RepID=A0AAD8IXS8_9APIA|nr:putative SWI/SNF-related matrix-associated actin-dependent regulator of chromatin subfamily A member 3-like 1 [Heracleum sosnowskyi]
MADEDDPVNVYLRLNTWPDFPTDGEEIVAGMDPTNVMSDFGETYMLGFIIANIVGIQSNSGTITGREMVSLIRDPLNPFDCNAIRVVNIRNLQVGFIEKCASDVLAPLLDDNLISIEGIVPNNQGRRGTGMIPCQVHVFAINGNVEGVYVAIARSGLELIRTDEECVRIPEIVRQNADDRKRLNDIFKVESQGGMVEVMEAPREVIKSELFLHQKEGLAWLVKRENSGELPPFWVERSGGTFYYEITDFETNERPQPLHGGIFADDMGMGKTLTLLSLIALDQIGYGNNLLVHGASESNVVDDDDDDDEFVVYGGKNPKKGRGTKMVNRIKKRNRSTGNLDNARHEYNLIDAVALRTTLVVCPPSVFSTWITQLGEHTKRGKLKVYLYYGDRTDDPMELTKYDMVLTTYTTLGSELNLESPMFRVAWWRVILDEAHMIKNSNAQQTRAVNKLIADRRWLVTGTPIQNGTLDLFSLMSFLRYQPFANRNYWNTLVQRPVDHGDEFGLTRLQAVMATICLRRTKDKGLLGLPQKMMEICYIDLSAEERELYDRIEGEAKTVVRDYISSNRVANNYTTVLSIILRLRQICTDVDLCPKDLIASLPPSNIEDVSNNPELLKKLVAMLDDGEDFDCPICISTPTNIVITRCAHIYCKSCILKTLKRAKPRCPLCRHQLLESDLFSPPQEVSENAEVVSSSKSSKTSALLKLLSASRDQDPTAKSVIFSQFRKMLILLEEPLKNAGFKVLRLDGSMNAKKRSQVIKDFGVPAPGGPTVLLASLKASGTGVNLAAANRVYLLEPWWNPAVEEQAMDRVHRIGQTKEVTIVRIIARNSIEERILELQDKKKRMASEAFERKGGPAERREINIDDIRTLISLTG